MWVKPGHHVEQPRPPAENGQRLATFPRGDGAEMRVNLSEYQGRPFVSLRVWERGQDSALWPVKGKGCSVRLGEASGLIDALQTALAAAGEMGRQQDRAGQGAEHNAAEQRPAFVDRGRPVREPFDVERLAPAEQTGDRGEFNEF